MAVATVLSKVTEHSITLIQRDDGGGGANIIDNASLIAAMTLYGINRGGLWDLLTTDFNPNNQNVQRRTLLGDASGLGAQDLRQIPHCVVTMDGATADGFLVDADVDAVAAGRGELNVTGPAAAGDVLLTIHFVHTAVR